MAGARDRYERGEAQAPGTFCARCHRHFQRTFSLWLLIRTLYDPDKRPGTLAHMLWIEGHAESLDALIQLTSVKWPNEEVRAVHAFIERQGRSMFGQADDVANSQEVRLARSVVRA